jgi:regulator of sigma D
MATGWSYEQITDWNSGISEKQLIDAIIKIFVPMVSDDSVSVIEFSECLHDIVVTDDGCSCDWLVI